MVSSRGTLVKGHIKLDTSKEHMKALGSMSRFCQVVMERDAKFVMERTCHRQYWAKRSAFFVCFGKPYIRGLCDPVGCIASFFHFGIKSALTKSSNRF